MRKWDDKDDILAIKGRKHFNISLEDIKKRFHKKDKILHKIKMQRKNKQAWK